jgi:hypothetical protein
VIAETSWSARSGTASRAAYIVGTAAKTVAAWVEMIVNACLSPSREEAAIAPVCTRLAALATARVGVIQRIASLEVAPQALRQARVACLAAAPRSREVVRYKQAPVAVLLASAPEAGSAFAQSVLWSGAGATLRRPGGPFGHPAQLAVRIFGLDQDPTR